MNKIYNLFIIFFSCIIMAACDNYDYTNSIDSVKVASAETTIPASGGTKSIAVKSANNVTAYAKDKWLNVLYNGDSIKVNAKENVAMYSRHTIVVIKSGKDSTIVNVSQNGAVFSLNHDGVIYAHDSGTVCSYKMKCNVPITFISGKNWFSGKYVNDSLYVTILQNTNDESRYGYLKYSYGDITDSIKVVQFDAKDLAGNWNLQCYYGIDTTGGNVLLKDTILKASAIVCPDDNNSLNISINHCMNTNHWNSNPYILYTTMHATFDNDKMIFNAGDYIGDYICDYGNYYAFLCATAFQDSKYLVYTWSTNTTYSAEYNRNKSYTFFKFEDNGSWSDLTVSGINIGFFNTKNKPKYPNIIHGLSIYMMDPVMYRDN